jgi:quinoprotein dehydrogenase-associated probable ABC transporter substrate-binding protein
MKASKMTTVLRSLFLILFACLTGVAANAAERKALKVCADPYSLPTSNKEQQGYENKIAALFAKDLGLPLQYEWFPQRIGFIRNTLKNNDTPDQSYKCDIVMGVVDNFELAATTKPYYHSAWAMVYVKGRGLDTVKTPQDLANLPPDRKKALRIGLFDRSPATQWVFKHDLLSQMVPYQIMSGDARAYPGEILEKDLVNDKINLTFIWGPIAGYFAKQIKDHTLVVIPMVSEPGMKFDYRIAMAVRRGEKEWKDQVNSLIDKHKDEIHTILTEYGVPLLEN